MSEMDDWARNLQREIDRHREPKERRIRRPKPSASRPLRGLTVTLAVSRPGFVSTYRWEHQSDTISRLQAKMEAESAARAEGWEVRYVYDIR